jgi:exodeoxyribonuclease III
MKIASFNINNINRRLTNLLHWLREAEPDIVCLQELKAEGTEFPTEAIRQAGYHAVRRGERRWNGVAILARWTPVVTRMDLPGDAPDGQCRYLEAAVNGVLVASIYAPNGNPQPGPKFDYKLAWLRRLNAHAAELYATGAPVVLAGDYNIVPTNLDIYPTKGSQRTVAAAERAAYQRLLAQGWTDAVRALHPKEPIYTFWDYMRNRWPRRRATSRSRFAKSRFDGAFAKRRRRSSGTRNGGRQRPCARVVGVSRCARPAVFCEPWWQPRANNGRDGVVEI